MSVNFLHPQDQIRQGSFQSFYQWAINVAGLNNKHAFFLAKKKVLAKYPIVLGEPLYPINNKSNESKKETKGG